MTEIIDKIEPAVADRATRIDIYTSLIESFSDMDCDTLDECFDRGTPLTAFAEAYYAVYGDVITTPDEDEMARYKQLHNDAGAPTPFYLEGDEPGVFGAWDQVVKFAAA